jgi:hypothetical protein
MEKLKNHSILIFCLGPSFHQFAAAQARTLVLQEEEGHFSQEDLWKILPHELVSYD